MVQLSKTWVASQLLACLLLFSGIFVALSIDSDFSKLEVEKIIIENQPFKLSGLLYRPKSAVADNLAPGVVLAHGIGSSKEMMSSLGLELARKGFVSLCLDLYGHGQSAGTVADGRREPSFGVCSAIKYLKSQPFVNSSALVLIGHSLGAGAVRAAVQGNNVVAGLILIAGGIGEAVEGIDYAMFNSTFPRNLLVIVGKYDILIDAEELTHEVLPPAFGITEPVIPGVLYGNFSAQTARKLVLPSTTHLFEPLDSIVVSESIGWAEKVVSKSQGSQAFAYLQREFAILFALCGVLGIPLLFLYISTDISKRSPMKPSMKAQRTRSRWRLYSIWGFVNLIFFIPLFIAGLGISFPPLIFGSSVAWWLLTSGLIGLLLLIKFPERIIGRKMALKDMLSHESFRKTIILAVAIFVILFVGVTFFMLLLPFSFRIITPILTSFSSFKRILAFAAFTPFFLPYFIAEGLYLHKLSSKTFYNQTIKRRLQLVAEKVLGKTAPIITLLFLQYATKITIGFWLIPGFLGFLLEFLWLIIPIFIIAIVFSTCFYEKTGSIIPGAFFNTLLLAWIASATFPF